MPTPPCCLPLPAAAAAAMGTTGSHHPERDGRLGVGERLKRRGCLAWKRLVPGHHQGTVPAVCSKGGLQACGALGVLPTAPQHGLSPPRHPSGHPADTHQPCTQGRTWGFSCQCFEE